MGCLCQRNCSRVVLLSFYAVPFSGLFWCMSQEIRQLKEVALLSRLRRTSAFDHENYAVNIYLLKYLCNVQQHSTSTYTGGEAAGTPTPGH